MDSKKKKTLILNTLLLIFCVTIIALFCISPNKEKTILETYRVNFDSEGGTSIAAIEIEEGSYASRPENPTREGYIFVGWMLGDELFDFSQEISGDITLRAEWREIEPDTIYYTITFDTAGGSYISNQTLEEGTIPTRPADPTKEGYTFAGWTYDGSDYDFTSALKNDITIIANWTLIETPEEPPTPVEPERKTYTVRFDLNGGTGTIRNQTISEGGKVTKPADPTRNGYTFNGWTFNGSSYNFNAVVNRDITLVAEWRQIVVNRYNVYFVNNNSTIKNIIVEQGGRVPNGDIPSVPNIVFRKFDGWFNTQSSTGGTSIQNSSITSDSWFYARYSSPKITVTCVEGVNDQGGASGFCPLAITTTAYITSSVCVELGSGCLPINGQGISAALFRNMASVRVCEDSSKANCVQATKG